MRSSAMIVSAFLAAASLVAAGCDPRPGSGSVEEPMTGEYERGPHGGRLLRDGGLALELQVFEDGVPPEFHVYLYRDQVPLPPEAATVAVELTRLDGEVNRFTFLPQGDFLRGDGVVTEPHSFAVVVTARVGDADYRWAYDSFEGRTQIDAATAATAGIAVEAAGPARIGETLVLTGRVVPDPERTRSVSARFPGPIREVLRSVGDRVRAGEAMAVVESNESLEQYAVVAPIDGVIVDRDANPGEIAGGEALFEIVDPRFLRAELAVFPRDLPRIRAGQQVVLSAGDDGPESAGRILRLLAMMPSGGASPAGLQTAHVAIDNSDGRWAPGMFVEGTVRIAETEVPLAVRRSGLQQFRDFTVVFAQIGETYEVRMLELGRQDDTWVEVTGGLKPGTTYVTASSYLIKADIEKSGASHDH